MLSNKYIKNKTIKIWGATYIYFGMPFRNYSFFIFFFSRERHRKGRTFVLPLWPSSHLPLLPPHELAYLPDAPNSLGDFFLPFLSALSPSFGLLLLAFRSAVLCHIYFPCWIHVVAHPSVGPLRLHLGSSSPIVAVASRSSHFPPATFLPDLVSIFVFLLEFVFVSFGFCFCCFFCLLV
jgi:hypothetical protein